MDNRINVLVAPAHYHFSDKIRSEPAWAYALVKLIGPRVRSMDVISGISDLSSPLPDNINVYPIYPGRSNSLFLEFIRHLAFYPLVTFKALELMFRKRYSIVHHILPLSYATFNPTVILVKIFFPKTKVILGPLQLPQTQVDEQDLNVVYLGKQEYSLVSKLSYYATRVLTILVKPLSRLMFETADLVVCNSQTSLQHYSSRFPKAKFRVIYTGMDKIQVSRPKKKRQGKTKIMCAGVFSKRKGQIYLLQAIKDLIKSHPDVELTLIGGGDQDSVYRGFVKDNRLEKTVKFTGQISYAQLLQAYQTHDIFCLPTLSDTSPYVILEAMTCGLPIVSTDVGSIREMVGGAGIVVPPGDSAALKTALNKLITNPRLVTSMGQIGPKRVNDNFTWQKITDQWLTTYSNLLT